MEWTVLLSELDRLKGRIPGIYKRSDVQAQLRMLTERLGELGHPLDDKSRLVSTLGSELRIVRNRVAHMDEMDLVDAWRAADFVVRLLSFFDDSEGHRAALELRDNIMRLSVPEPEPVPPAIPARQPGSGNARQGGTRVVAEGASQTMEGQPAIVLGESQLPFEPWVVAPLGDVSCLDQLRAPRNAQQVRAAIQEIVEAEGPVHIGRVSVLVGRAFGLSRVEEKRRRAIRHQASNAAVDRDEFDFLWPPTMSPASWSGFRPQASLASRDFSEISPHEIANAIRSIAAGDAGIEPATIDRLAASVFGAQKLTAKVRVQLELARRLVRA